MADPLVIVEMLGAPRGKGSVRRDRLPNGITIAHPDAKTAEYEGNLRLAAKHAMAGRAPFDQPLRVLVEAHFPVPGSWSGKKRAEALRGVVRPAVKPDWDNLGKICDGANAILWVDDKLIVEGAVIKLYSERPLIRVTAWAIGPATGAVNDLFVSAA